MTWRKERRSLVVICGEPDWDQEGVEWEWGGSGAGPPQVERGGKERQGSCGYSCLLEGDTGTHRAQMKHWRSEGLRATKTRCWQLTVPTPRRPRTVMPPDCSACRCLQIDPLFTPTLRPEDTYITKLPLHWWKFWASLPSQVQSPMLS